VCPLYSKNFFRDARGSPNYFYILRKYLWVFSKASGLQRQGAIW
jgi:hypothetical protein